MIVDNSFPDISKMSSADSLVNSLNFDESSAFDSSSNAMFDFNLHQFDRWPAYDLIFFTTGRIFFPTKECLLFNIADGGILGLSFLKLK